MCISRHHDNSDYKTGVVIYLLYNVSLWLIALLNDFACKKQKCKLQHAELKLIHCVDKITEIFIALPISQLKVSNSLYNNKSKCLALISSNSSYAIVQLVFHIRGSYERTVSGCGTICLFPKNCLCYKCNLCMAKKLFKREV